MASPPPPALGHPACRLRLRVAFDIDMGHGEVSDQTDDQDGHTQAHGSPTPVQAAEGVRTPIQSANEAPSGRVMM